MDDDYLSFEEHRRRRQEDEQSVCCFRCGKSIPAVSTRCPECGIHFQGIAEDFAEDADEPHEHDDLLYVPRWVLLVIVAAVGIWLYVSTAKH